MSSKCDSPVYLLVTLDMYEAVTKVTLEQKVVITV